MYRNLTVVGEDILESEWPEVEEMAELVEECGMNIIKILNYKEGSTKFIAKLGSGESIQKVRTRLEDKEWRLGSPYYSHGRVIGFKVAKDRKAREVSPWGD